VVGALSRGNTPVNGGILGGQSESIPAHGMKNRVPLHPARAGQDIGDGVVTDMAHVQVPGGIGEHREGIEFRLVPGQVRG